jgi:hypothetical protein
MGENLPLEAHDLIARLPRSFGPSLNDQLAQWDLLFPAEQRQLRAQNDWLTRLPAREFEQLFQPIMELEAKMDLPRWDPGTRGLSITDSGILARSPYYPKWRTEAEQVFAKIDTGVGPAGALRPVPRLVASILPAGLPASSDPLWPALASQGTWVPLEKPFGASLGTLVAALLARKRPAGLEDVESTWIFECDSRFTEAASAPDETVLSWAALETVRSEFLKRFNAVQRDLKSVDATSDELKRRDIGRGVPAAIAREPRVREFARGVLLSGNGSLVFPNSFVQWGASEALRRAQPQVLMARLGMRQKLKPFSSLVLFEDQQRSNPTPDADDAPGSLVDALMLAEYVYLAAQRVTAYQARTLTLLTGEDLDRVLLIGAKPPMPSGRLSPERLTAFAVKWLESEE